jgi:glucosamine--fructose-6-phosphate aminotransferase (isomerizing)
MALAAALDASLKMQETAGIPAQPWSTAEFLHGPIGAMNPHDAAVLLSDAQRPSQSFEAVVKQLVTSGTRFLVVAGESDSPLPGDLTLRVPLPPVRWAATPVFCFLSQLVALELASRQGLDADRPAGLNKITQT